MKKLVSSLALAILCFSAPAHAALYWTPWVSEEGGGPPTFCTALNEGAVGFGCRGNYCDDVRLFCETLPFAISFQNYQWTGFFSEEDSGIGRLYSSGWYRYDGDNYEVCHGTWTAGIVTGIRCRGNNCDDISLECARPVKTKYGVTYSATLTNCSWSGWYSEEQGSVDFGWNRYITGVQCGGSNCDNKRFLVCSLVDPAP